MSQHDYNIANGGGAAVRADLNLALAAVLSQNSGATAPTTTKPFMTWYDTTTGVLKMRNAADTAWIAAIDAVTGGNSQTMKNRIINGAMVIDQRNAGAAVTPTAGTYTLDRWQFDLTQASKFTAQRNAGSVTPPAGFTNYLGMTSSSAYSVVSSDYFRLIQKIEGFNVADLGWGTASAQTVTLSFWVRSSLTGTFGGAFRNAAGSRSYPFSYVISSANTWEQKTIVVAGDTTGTWATDNTSGIELNWSLGAGATFSGTAGAWASANLTSATGAVSVVGTSGAAFYITGVQLEKGSTATSFDYRPYGTELALCQRYYEVQGDANQAIYARGTSSTGGAIAISLPFAVTKRAAPTITKVGTWTASNCGQPTSGGASIYGYSINALITTGAFDAYFLTTAAGQKITAEAEL